MKQILIAAILILLMSGITSATIETDIPYGTRNHLPDDPTYVRIDFEDGGTHFNSYPGVVNFVPLDDNKWDSVQIGERAYHIHPMDFFHNSDGSQVDYIYIVNGERAAQPVYWWCNNVKCEWWPGSKGRIEFPTGASDVSLLLSNGAPVQMKAYDKTGKYLGYSGVAYSNIERVPPNPSTFTRVSFTTKTPIIYAVEIISSQNNYWLGDDFVIGGLTFPDQPTNYSWAAERLKQLIGLPYLQYGTAWDYVIGDYRTAKEMTDDTPDPYFNFDYKQPELEFGIGINDQDAILFAFNGNGEELINWWDTNKMAKQDFTEEIPYEEIQPGDVFFIDYPQEFADGGYGPDGCYDEIGMVIEPTVDSTEDIVDIIRITPADGVHYSTTEFINALHGITGFVDYRRLPDNPKGGHSPYPKKPPGTPI